MWNSDLNHGMEKKGVGKKTDKIREKFVVQLIILWQHQFPGFDHCTMII